MGQKENLRTIRKLERLEAGIIELHNPRRYLRDIARRLSYVLKKQNELPPTVIRPTYLECERDALFWLLSHYAVAMGYDVRSVLTEQESIERLDLERFDEVLAAVKYARTQRENESHAGPALPNRDLQLPKENLATPPPLP